MKSLIIFSLILFSGVVGAEALKPASYLYKISYRLTGTWPTAQDYTDLSNEMKERKCSQISCMEDYFRTYIQKQMNRTEFYSEAVLKVYEKFAFQTPKSKPFPLISSNASIEPLLVYRVFSQNLSIDELFIAQNYWERYYEGNKSIYSGLDDFEIRGKANENTPVDVSELKTLTNSNSEMTLRTLNFTGHANIAGLFSTKMFLERYWNNPVNGNRKRAAAIFKIMLCDPMTPALERDQQQAREHALALGISEAQVSERTLEEIHRNRHANQQDCKQCHMRLDPVARTLRPLEQGISTFASPGRLRYFDSFQMMKDVPVKNFSSLIKEATQPQKYIDCQMNWLFTWIIGKDVNIHPSRFAAMIEDFENNGRKVKTTIENLLLSPEFRREKSRYIEPVSLIRAKAVLRQCSECHGSFLNTGGKQLVLNIKKIVGKLDLAHDGENRQMPPDYSLWQPKEKDIQAIKNWIQEGAPLIEGGKQTLSDEDIALLLKVTRGQK